jgi:hypothetical protein
MHKHFTRLILYNRGIMIPEDQYDLKEERDVLASKLYRRHHEVNEQYEADLAQSEPGLNDS